MDQPSGDTFDYVIVGAGSAGALLASRLAERDGVTICLLEAGPKDSNPFIGIPAGFLKVIFDPKLTWGFTTEPGEHIDGRSVPALQGHVVGGSAAINGMVYTRGQADDFNGWAQRGNRGWSYADILPYFMKTERRTDGGGDEGFRGRSGKLPIVDLHWKNPLLDRFFEAAGAIGIPRNHDFNGARQEGAGTYQYNIGRGKRVNTARAFLKDGIKTGRIDLRTQARASRVLFDGTTASGVEYVADRGGQPQRVFARREVILSGGALNTPRLLQLSGIGAPALLDTLGVPVISALPGVGENLRDHFTPRTVVRVTGAPTINDYARGPKLIGQGLRWLTGRPSVIGIGVVLGHAFWKSDPALDRADMLVTFTPGSFKEGFLGVLDDKPGMTLGAWQLRPESVGYVRARSTDIFDTPAVQPNYLAAANDRRVLLSGQKMIRQLLAQPALAQHVAEEVIPGPAVQSDDELMAYARRQGLGGYHYCGTAKMGPASDPMAVVDDTLRVRGVQRLRVVDASIMPDIPSGNTNAPTMMIAEKAADLILHAD